MNIRDRIKDFRRVPATDLIPNPKNWREHPPAQVDAMRGVLAEIGFAGAALARETEDGLMLIDGHLRVDEANGGLVPVLVLDLDEAEADVLLATFDPIAAMAETNVEQLLALQSSIGADPLAQFIKAEDHAAIDLTPVDTRSPPRMTWALIGVPTVKYGDIAGLIEAIADNQHTTLFTASNDG